MIEEMNVSSACGIADPAPACGTKDPAPAPACGTKDPDANRRARRRLSDELASIFISI